MKTPEEMMEYFRSMPSRKKENPYWRFSEERSAVDAVYRVSEDVESAAVTVGASCCIPFDLDGSRQTLLVVREFFRRFYESFQSEAQVLCVTPEDGKKLAEMAVPVLTEGQMGPFVVTVMVLPQDNHMGTSVISEWFWQNRIVNEDITPVARIHSHHVLDPYQSMTDYSTLNSGTLEMVIGRIQEDPLSICYWLDVPGTDIKARTFLARERLDETFEVIPHVFNGPESRPMDRKGFRQGPWHANDSLLQSGNHK